MAQLELPTLSTAIAVLLALLLGTAVVIYAYATRHFAYWRRKGLPFLPPLPFLGNIKDVVLFRKHMGHALQEMHTEMKEKPYIGIFIFDQPVLLVKDISLWKTILTTDFECFNSRGFSPVPSDTIFSETLFSKKGQPWKELRKSLNPAFTTGKLKKFYVLFEQKAINLGTYFDEAVRKGNSCNVVNACTRYTIDAIAAVSFGIDSRALLDDDDPLYRLLHAVWEYSKFLTLASLGTFVDLPLLRLLGVSLVPAPLARFLRRTVWEVVSERERRGTEGTRGDFLDLLMELRRRGRIAADEGDGDDAQEDEMMAAFRAHVIPATENKASVDMDGDVMISQVFSVFGAGFDTTMTTMSYALYHLAKDQQIQDKLRFLLRKSMEEHDGKLTYEALQSVDYLDMIFLETLRMYPVLPFLDRMCTKKYRIPGSDVVLDKGVFVFASTLGFHKDPEIFPEPERFDPERFSADNKKNIPIGAYFPFGEGPRKCIGMRLAMLQGKLGIAHVVLNYRLQPCTETKEKMEYNLNSFFIHPRDGVRLKLTRV